MSGMVGPGEQMVVEVFSPAKNAWFVGLVMKCQDDVLLVRFVDQDGGVQQKVSMRADPSFATLGTNMELQLPPGFLAVPSNSRPGEHSFFDPYTKKKVGSLAFAWKAYLLQKFSEAGVNTSTTTQLFEHVCKSGMSMSPQPAPAPNGVSAVAQFQEEKRRCGEDYLHPMSSPSPDEAHEDDDDEDMPPALLCLEVAPTAEAEQPQPAVAQQPPSAQTAGDGNLRRFEVAAAAQAKAAVAEEPPSARTGGDGNLRRYEVAASAAAAQARAATPRSRTQERIALGEALRRFEVAPPAVRQPQSRPATTAVAAAAAALAATAASAAAAAAAASSTARAPTPAAAAAAGYAGNAESAKSTSATPLAPAASAQEVAGGKSCPDYANRVDTIPNRVKNEVAVEVAASAEAAPARVAAVSASVEEWVASYIQMPVRTTPGLYYFNRIAVNYTAYLESMMPVAFVNQDHRDRIIGEIESGDVMRTSLDMFTRSNVDDNGDLHFHDGSIRDFVTWVFHHHNIGAPTDELIQPVFDLFDVGKSGKLSVWDSVCMVDALMRSTFIKEFVMPEAPDDEEDN